MTKRRKQQQRIYCKMDKRYVGFCNLISCKYFRECRPERFDEFNKLIKFGDYFRYSNDRQYRQVIKRSR